MKKVINRILLVIGIIFIALILISNIFFDVRLSNNLSEYANIELIQITNLLLVAILSVGLTYLLKKMLEAKSRYIIPYLIVLIPLASKGILTKVKPIKMIEGK